MQMMVGSPKNQQQSGGGSSRPDSITSLPAPTDPAVRLAVAGGEIVAVMPFEGYITPDTAASVRKQLVSALEAGMCVCLFVVAGVRSVMQTDRHSTPAALSSARVHMSACSHCTKEQLHTTTSVVCDRVSGAEGFTLCFVC